MPKLLEMKEKRTRLIAEAQRVLLGDKLDAEQRASANSMMTEVETLEKDIASLDKLAAIEEREATAAADAEKRARAAGKPPRPNPDGAASEEQEERELERRAFTKYIRFGENSLDPEERKALRSRNQDGGTSYHVPRSVVEGANTEKRDVLTTGPGGSLIPQLFLPTLIEAKKWISGAVNVVRKKVTDNNGAPMKIALANDTFNALTTVVPEATLVPEQDPGFSSIMLQTDMVATLVKTSVQELADSYFSLDSWLKDRLGTRYVRGLEALITKGNGSNVAGLVAGVYTVPPTAANTGPAYDDFVAAYGALDPAYLANAMWMMSQKSRAILMGQKDGFGRPFFIPNPNTGALDSILGYPIVLNQQMDEADVAGNTGILFGDFNEGYILRTDGDVTILRLNERFIDTLEIGFLAYARVGGAVTDAGTHPIVKMATHA